MLSVTQGRLCFEAGIPCRAMFYSPLGDPLTYSSKEIVSTTSSMSTTRRMASIWGRVVVAASREASSQRQPVLSNAEKKVLRQKAQRMHESLVTVNAGDKGLTVNFLSGLFDALKANQLVKVRMGCSRQEKKTKTEELERILDCVCVHSIGSVVILYRQKGLSKPPEIESLLRGNTVDETEKAVSSTKNSGSGSVQNKADIPDEFTVIKP